MSLTTLLHPIKLSARGQAGVWVGGWCVCVWHEMSPSVCGRVGNMISASRGQTCTQSTELCPCHCNNVFTTRSKIVKSFQQTCLEMLPKSFFFFQEPIFLFDFKQLHKSNRGLIFDPSFSNAGWKIAFHARKGRRKQPADTQHTEHARCQPLFLNLMPLSLPPPLSLISLSARNECWWQGCQQRFVSSSVGEHYLPVCLCYTNAPQSCSPLLCPSQLALLSIAEANGDMLNHSTLLLHAHFRVSRRLTAQTEFTTRFKTPQLWSGVFIGTAASPDMTSVLAGLWQPVEKVTLAYGATLQMLISSQPSAAWSLFTAARFLFHFGAPSMWSLYVLPYAGTMKDVCALSLVTWFRLGQ